jgi:GRAM domain-containing protein 4
LRILYALIHNRILPHPTLSELRRHRKEVRRADEFGKEIQARLSSSSILEIKEVWRMFSLYRRAKKARSKIRPEELTKDEPDDPTVLDEPEASKDEQDIKRAVLRVTTEIADLHERIKKYVQ